MKIWWLTDLLVNRFIFHFSFRAKLQIHFPHKLLVLYQDSTDHLQMLKSLFILLYISSQVIKLCILIFKRPARCTLMRKQRNRFVTRCIMAPGSKQEEAAWPSAFVSDLCIWTPAFSRTVTMHDVKEGRMPERERKNMN